MGGFFEIRGTVEFQVPHMGKMNPAFEGADHVGQVVLQVRAVGAGTEGNAVVRIIHHFHHAQDIFLVDDDAGQAENAPGRIVGMDGHVDIVFVADRHDAFQEIFQVGKQLFFIDILIHGEKVFDFLHALRFPAGHDRAVGIAGNGCKHIFRIQFVHCFLSIGKNGGAVRAYSGKFGPCPVENGHKVVADHMDIRFSQVLQSGDVIVYVDIPFRGACFDGVVDVYAFNAGELQTRVLNFFFEGENVLKGPGFSGNGVVKGGDHAGYAGDLADLFQGYGIESASVPS